MHKFALICVGLILGSITPCVYSTAETLKDVRHSKALEKVLDQTERSRSRRLTREGDYTWLAGMDPSSNFSLLFETGRGPALLLNWAGANLPGYRLIKTDSERSRERAYATTTFSDPARRLVTLDILVPHPTYYTMAEYKTLADFNRYEPPTLKVVASEEISLNDRKVTFYRSEGGRCSLLFRLPKHSMLNLETRNCEDSNLMMEIGKNLDIARLLKKLES